MINKLQSLKGKTKFKFFSNINLCYNERKNKIFQTKEDSQIKDHQLLKKSLELYAIY